MPVVLDDSEQLKVVPSFCLTAAPMYFSRPCNAEQIVEPRGIGVAGILCGGAATATAPVILESNDAACNSIIAAIACGPCQEDSYSCQAGTERTF